MRLNNLPKGSTKKIDCTTYAMRSARLFCRLLSMNTLFALLALSSCESVPPSTQERIPPSATPGKMASALPVGDRSPETNRQVPASVSRNPSRLTLEVVARKALSWHPSINEAIGRMHEAAEGINTARAGYYPKLRGGIGTSYDTNGDKGLYPSLNVTGSQMVYDFGKVSNSVQVATANTAASRAQLLVAVDGLVRDVAYAVFEVQRYRALRVIALDQIADVRTIGKLVRGRTNKGASTQADQLQAEARVQAAQSKLYEIDTQLGRWETQLATLIGSSGALELAPEVPPGLAKACETVQPDWSRIPVMMRAEAKRAEASAQLATVQSESLPTVSLEADANTSMTNVSSDTTKFTIGLNVGGKIFDGGLANSQRNAATHALGASQAALDNIRFEVGRNFLEARTQTESLEQLLSTLKSRDDVMRETRDIYQHQYFQLGTRTLLDLLNADQELHQVQFSQVGIEYDRRKLWVDCLFNAGGMREAFALEDMTVRGVPLRQPKEHT